MRAILEEPIEKEIKSIGSNMLGEVEAQTRLLYLASEKGEAMFL